MSNMTPSFNGILRLTALCVLTLGTLGCTSKSLPDGEYHVAEGDNLSSLAKRKYGDKELWYVLLNANPDLKFRPDFVLREGEVIVLPAENEIDISIPKSVFPKTLPADYVVVPGDSLTFIALRCYGDKEKWKIIYEANKDTLSKAVLADPRRLFAGQVLKIPKKHD